MGGYGGGIDISAERSGGWRCVLQELAMGTSRQNTLLGAPKAVGTSSGSRLNCNYAKKKKVVGSQAQDLIYFSLSRVKCP